jgi:hypothetical protein
VPRVLILSSLAQFPGVGLPEHTAYCSSIGHVFCLLIGPGYYRNAELDLPEMVRIRIAIHRSGVSLERQDTRTVKLATQAARRVSRGGKGPLQQLYVPLPAPVWVQGPLAWWTLRNNRLQAVAYAPGPNCCSRLPLAAYGFCAASSTNRPPAPRAKRLPPRQPQCLLAHRSTVPRTQHWGC